MLTATQVVKYIKSSKFAWDPKKGELGFIFKVIATSPGATEDIYLVHFDNAGIAWVGGSEVIPWNQLQLPI